MSCHSPRPRTTRRLAIVLAGLAATTVPLACGKTAGPGAASDSAAEGGTATEGGGGTGDATASDAPLPSDAPPSDEATDGNDDADRNPGAACTDPRPQLSPSDADRYTALAYLAQAGSLATGLVTDNWDPTPGLGDPTSFTPTYAVAADGGPYPTVQAAIDAATSRDGGSDRVYIFVSPGTYRELVCVPANAPPITLYGMDPVTTVIAYDHFNGQSTDSGAQNPCTATTNATLGTAGSATFAAFANDFQASNITFSNDVTVTTLGTTTGTQGVALMTRADKIVLDHVRVTGHQDTLYVETPNAGTVVRVYVRDSYVAGDVDFIFGGATTVLDGTEVHLVADRRTSGDAVSPDTDARNPYGMLIVQGTFSADANAAAGGFALGRAWDRSCVDIPTYLSTCVSTGQYPNGQAVIRDSMLGGPVAAAPWLPAATTKRPFCNTSWVCSADGGSAEADVCPANRLYEYLNTGPGSAH